MDSKIISMINSKKKRPHFRQENSNKLKRLRNQDHWRKPKGNTSSVRLDRKSYPHLVKKGYGAPRLIKGRFNDGLLPYYIKSIANVDETLKSIDKDEYKVVISAKLGLKNKILILKKCKTYGLKVYNHEDIDSYVKKVNEDINKRKETHNKIKKKKSDKVKKAKAEKPKKTSKGEKSESEKSSNKTSESVKSNEVKDNKKEDEIPSKSISPQDSKIKEKQDLDKILTKPK
ncbi:MAG: hypothetical protein GWP09_02175 [Nitrospiraceae bacterium]|nr:hypothetical protein [Nitrospiraceae bacterium]